MHADTYGFIDLEKGRLLRFVAHDGPFDEDDDMQISSWFSMDPEDPVWETSDLAAIVDLLHPWSTPYLSEDAIYSLLPAKHGGGSRYVEPAGMTPVAFRRTMAPVVEGGDHVAVAMEVFAVSFDVDRDLSSVRLEPLAERSLPRPR